MNIGFVYDPMDHYLSLGMSREEAAEFDKPETIDGIAATLEELGHSVVRVGPLRELMRRLLSGERWDLAFNIAEGLGGAGREAQVPALLEAFGIPCVFGDSVCLALCLHKAHTKSVVRDHGLPTPDFALVRDASFDFDGCSLRYPLFVKPVAEGTGKGVTAAGRVKDATKFADIATRLIARHQQPALAEEFLPGREFTVGILGTGPRARGIGVMEVLLRDNAEPGVYSYDNKDQYLDRVEYRLAEDDEARRANELALACYRVLDCRDAGRIDIRSDANGNPSFIEANPLAGLNPLHSDLPILCRLVDIPYRRLLETIIESAAERI